LPSIQFPLQLPSALFTAVLLAILFTVLRDLHKRYLIRRWIRSLTAASKACQSNQFAEAHRFLQDAMARSAQLPRHWKIRAVTSAELAALLAAEGKYAEAEKFRRNDLALRLASSNPTEAAQLAEKSRAARESHAANESAFV
jgi:hypothetical protein